MFRVIILSLVSYYLSNSSFISLYIFSNLYSFLSQYFKGKICEKIVNFHISEKTIEIRPYSFKVNCFYETSTKVTFTARDKTKVFISITVALC